MSHSDPTSGTAVPTADYAIDLSRDGISLYERLDTTNWKCVETVPLQVGTLARKFEHLRRLAGGHDNMRPLVDVWLPHQEVKVALINFTAAEDMEHAVFDTFTKLGCADPLTMSYDFEPALANGLTPVAGIPVDVLREAHEFIAAHGFDISSYTTARLPDNFKRPPDFPLYQPEQPQVASAPAVVEPVPVAAPAARPVTRPVPPSTAGEVPGHRPVQHTQPVHASTPAALANVATVKNDVTPGVAIKPRTAPNARPKPAKPAAVTSAKRDMSVSIGTKLLAGSAVAAMLALAALGLPKLLTPGDARNLPGDDAQIAAFLQAPASSADNANLNPVANLPLVAITAIAPVMANASNADRSDVTVGDSTTALLALIRAEAPAAPDIQQRAVVLPGDTRLSSRGIYPTGLGRIDPALTFGQFEGDVLMQLASLGALDVSNLLDVGANLSPTRDGALSRKSAPRSIPRQDPAMEMQHFVGAVQTQNDKLAAFKDTTAVDLAPYRIPQHTRQYVSLTTPTAVRGIDPSMSFGRFEGQLAQETAPLSAPVISIAARGFAPAATTDFGPVRSAVGLPYLDPTTRLGHFVSNTQTAVQVLDGGNYDLASERTAPPSAMRPVRVATMSKLDLVDSHSADKVISSARIIQPFAGNAPKVDALRDNNMALPIARQDTRPIVAGEIPQLADLTALDEATPANAATLDRIPLAAPGQSILDGGMLTPDNEPASGRVPGMAALSPSIQLQPAIQLAALTPAGDTPLAVQTLPPPMPEPERTVTDTHVLVIGGRPDVLPKLRPRAEVETTPDAGDADAEDAPLIAVIDERPDLAAPESDVSDDAATDTSPPSDGVAIELPQIAVISDRPAIVPPTRADEENEAEDTGEHISNNGVRVVAALPDIVPPIRFGATTADDSTLIVQEPTEEQLTIAAMIIKAQREGDLEPTNFALEKASSPSHRPAEMVEAARALEIELASLLPSDLALTAADSPKARPASLAAATSRTTTSVNPNTGIKPSEFHPGPQLPTVANVARSATISNALPMRQMALIGVFGSTNNRHALLRMSNGKRIKVATGDSVSGYNVTAISSDAIRLNKRGKDTLLVIPE